MITKVAIRNLRAHKVRLALTALAVILGVSFVAGTLIFTQTLQNTFDTLFAQIGKGTDVVVRGQTAFNGRQGQTDRRLVPDSLVARVRKVAGVAQLLPSVTGYAAVVGKDGKVVANTGPPTIGVAWHANPELSPLRLTAGRGPRSAGEVAIDTVTAAKAKYRPGDRIRILTRGPAKTMTLVGVFQFGSLGNLAGATLTAFDPATAQRLLLKPGYASEIAVHAAPGLSQSVLRARVQAVLPAGFEAVTGAQVAKENATMVQQALKFLNTFLLVFGFLAVFVGTFIIFNTFSMLVAQRTRELALLRAVGASRAQVTRAVMGEAFGVGVFAATVGLALGFGLAKLLRILLSAFGISLPTSGLGLNAQAVVWSYVVGIAVTLAAAFGPARRAAKIPPVAALRDDVAMPTRSLRLRMVAGAAVTLAGAAMIAGGLARALSGASTAALTGAGAALVFVGAAMLAPAVSRPVVRVLAAPFPRSFGTPGRLAKQNALRNPRRTAATASALMIGLALIGAVTVLNSSAQVSIDKAVASGFGADYVVTSRSFAPFGPEVTTTLAGVPGVTSAVPLYVASARLDGKVRFVTAGDAAGITRALRLSVVSGSASASGILVPQNYADAYHLRPGAVQVVEFQDGAPVRSRVAGIYATSQIFNDVVIPTAMYRAHTSTPLVNDVFLTVENGAGTGVRTDLRTVLAGYPNLKLLDQTGIKDEAKGQIATLTNIILALLLLAVIIAAIGIVNTLALSVVERTREIGLLRAVGMSRRQLRRMVRLEAVVISVFGALLGLALGLAFGAALRRSLASDGFTTLSIPVLQLAGYVIGAALIGMIAAVWPAWRASRLNVLGAIAAE